MWIGPSRLLSRNWANTSLVGSIWPVIILPHAVAASRHILRCRVPLLSYYGSGGEFLSASFGDLMSAIANTLVALVAALHVYFLVLEMFLWTKPLGLRTFHNSPEKAADSAVLAANQGLYNGFLAAGLVWGLVQSVPGFAFQIKMFFLLCVIVAGVYGAATVSRRLLFVQAAPAAIALILLWLA